MTFATSLSSVVIGPDGVLTNWVFDAVRLLAACNPEKTVVSIDRQDDIDGLLLPKPIYLTFYPSASVVSAISDGDVAILAVIDDPLDVIAYHHRRFRKSAIESVRAQTASAIANLAIGRSPRAQFISRGTSRTVAQALAQIASCLSLPATSDVIAQTAVALGSIDGGEALETALAARRARVDSDHAPRADENPNDAAVLATHVLEPMGGDVAWRHYAPYCLAVAVVELRR